MKRLFLIIQFLILAFIIHANSMPTSSYVYDSKGKAISINGMYYLQDVAYPSNPDMKYTDFFIFDNELYILSESGSILTLGGEEIHLLDDDNNLFQFVSAQGLFMTEGNIYIADYGNGSVLVFAMDTKMNVLTITEPDNQLYDSNVPFMPKKVIADKSGNIYVLVPDLYYGAVMFDSQGEFLGYFGANPTELTLSQMLDQSWKNLLNRTQRDAMERFVPVAYTSFDIDDEDFIYTCSSNIENEAMKIRMLNPSGKGLLDNKKIAFGDIFPDDELSDSLVNQTRFIDIDINNGLIAALDSARGRIFIYSEDGEVLNIFAGIGSQKGTFSKPISIEQDADHIYVLDDYDSSISIFAITSFGEAMLSAVSLFSDGLYQEASPYWREIQRVAPEFELAELGICKAEVDAKNYKVALRSLKLANDRVQYSLAFEKVRLDFIRSYFAWIILAIALLVLIYKISARKLRPYIKQSKRFALHKSAFFHPSDTLWQMKRKKEFTTLFPTIVFLAYFILSIIKYFNTGFIFNENDPDEFNILLQISSTIGLVVLWVVVNWAVSTISDGKGTLKEIYCSLSYVLIPMVVADIINLVLSHILIMEEGVFISWIDMASCIYSLVLLFIVVSTIHEYNLSKTIRNVLLTVLGILFIVFLVFLAIVLLENAMNIFSIIYNELALRR